MSEPYLNDIFRQYDMTRMKNEQIIERRNIEIEETIPEFKELREQIANEATAEAIRALHSKTPSSGPSKEYIEKNRGYAKKKAELLKKHGYPENYLAPVYDCEDCKDTGFINGVRCHCLKQQIVDAIYNQSGIKDILRLENFELFSYDYYSDDVIDDSTSLTPLTNIKKVVELCKLYIKEFDEHDDNLLFYGETGVGKTFLSHCIAKELLDTYHTVVYLTALELFDILAKNKFHQTEDEESISAKVRNILDCDLLIIDDLGTELTNSFTSSQLYYFIEERNIRKKSIIISTNLSFEELRERYSERIFSRFTNYKFLKIFGEDIRLLKSLSD